MAHRKPDSAFPWRERPAPRAAALVVRAERGDLLPPWFRADADDIRDPAKTQPLLVVGPPCLPSDTADSMTSALFSVAQRGRRWLRCVLAGRDSPLLYRSFTLAVVRGLAMPAAWRALSRPSCPAPVLGC